MKPRAFCELPAGLASVSLRLHGGAHCRPPISRMGNKAGYAEVILAALGLRSGEGAGAYVWAESDPDVRALLRAYPDPAMLRRIADIIRGWKDEEPRALWERLRAERKARGPAVEPDVAGWLTAGSLTHGGLDVRGPQRWSFNTGFESGETFARGPKGVAEDCHRLAEYAIAGQWAYRRGVPESGFNAGLLEDREPTETGGNGAKARTCEQEAGLWEPAIEAAAGVEQVAGWIQLQATSQPGGAFDPVKAGLGAIDSKGREWGTDNHWWAARRVGRLASRWPPVAVLATIPDAAALSALLGTPGDLEGVVCYMDPPYVGTTGYADDLPRADVVRFALDYHRAGAVVCVSEAVPVEELVAVGWHTADIAAGRKGQRRTFARVATEALTMNREPAHRVATQVSMFGGAP